MPGRISLDSSDFKKRIFLGKIFDCSIFLYIFIAENLSIKTGILCYLHVSAFTDGLKIINYEPNFEIKYRKK